MTSLLPEYWSTQLVVGFVFVWVSLAGLQKPPVVKCLESRLLLVFVLVKELNVPVRHDPHAPSEAPCWPYTACSSDGVGVVEPPFVRIDV